MDMLALILSILALLAVGPGHLYFAFQLVLLRDKLEETRELYTKSILDHHHRITALEATGDTSTELADLKRQVSALMLRVK